VHRVWNDLSFRQRLLLPIALMILSALASGVIALFVFSPDQFEYENEQEAGSVRAVARALNGALEASHNPEQMLDAFEKGLGHAEAIRYLPAGIREPLPPVHVRSSSVPAWFVSNLAIPDLEKSYAINIGSRHAGDIAFVPDLSADVWEKWVGFLAVLLAGSLPMLVAALGVHLIAGRAILPMERLGAGLVRMREGGYDTVIPLVGPPEIRKFCQEANRLAATLKDLSSDNRELLRRLVSLQDDERQRIARELHDEMGPLLFAIRANAAAMIEQAASGGFATTAPVRGIADSAEALQQANKRILQGLSPLYLAELGLGGSIEALLRDAGRQAPGLHIRSRMEGDLEGLDGLLSQTIYRIIQEGVTNVLRHTEASTMDVAVAIEGKNVVIEIADDGRTPPDLKFGRGLTGMSERVRALDGSLELRRENRRTVVLCKLPIDRESDVRKN
jgi:two-component system, NarL family, sensor histidine kinase UhpB